MLAALRFIGLLNAAIWLGSLVFFTACVGPSFFSEEMLRILGKPHAGAAAQVVLGRYFELQFWCAGIAVVHLVSEWLYTGRPVHRSILIVLGTVIFLEVAGGYFLQPRLKDLHYAMYHPRSTVPQREAARKSFGMLHGVAQTMNLLVLGGVLFYLWHTAQWTGNTRFLSASKFRG